jgi:hypothetical protein
MAFTTDYNKAQQGAYVAPEGDYETTIEQADFDKTSTGKAYIKLMLRIRNDIVQEGQGELIKHALYKRKEPTPNDPEGYGLGQVNQLSKVTDIGNGKSFSSLDEWLHALVGKPLRVTIKHEDFNGSTSAKVSYVYASNFPTVTQGFIAVNDGEVPF